jgi:hypothetical protein
MGLKKMLIGLGLVVEKFASGEDCKPSDTS